MSAVQRPVSVPPVTLPPRVSHPALTARAVDSVDHVLLARAAADPAVCLETGVSLSWSFQHVRPVASPSDLCFVKPAVSAYYNFGRVPLAK